MNNHGTFVISLDFELLWGVFDVINFEKNREYFKNTRAAIPETLNLFEKFNIHATWATVGMLFNENWDEWIENVPKSTPEYSNERLNAYKFGNKIISSKTEQLCFAPNIIKKIIQVPGQELATHTYSHYYCLEEGQSLKDFQNDLALAVEMAGKMNITLKSLVFPRNQIKQEYLQICNEHGIKTVRSNPSSWYWKNIVSNSLFTKFARTGDAYLPLGNKSYPKSDIVGSSKLPLEQKASRFFRPVEQNGMLRKLKLKRIKEEMTIAAKENKVYHLWWHPHNFGDRPEESLKDLKLLLEYFNMLRKRYNFQSANMAEIGFLLNKLN